MAYQEIPLTSIQVGKAIKKELWVKVRNSLIDHENRINSLAVGASPIEIFNFPVYNASSATSLSGLTYYRATTAFNISVIQIELFEKGSVSSGILSLDIKKGSSLDPLSMNTVLTTQPQIDFSTASDYDISQGILDPLEQAVQQNDVLRLDITSLPSVPVGGFRVFCYGTL